MSYDEFKTLCKEARKKENSYLKIGRLDDGEKNVCISKIFNPVIDPF